MDRPLDCTLCRAGAAAALLAMLALAACGGTGGALPPDASGPAPAAGAPPAALPATQAALGMAALLPSVPDGARTASQTALALNGAQAALKHAGAQVSGNRLLLDAPAGPKSLLWGVYEFTTTNTAQYAVELRCTVGAGSGPYWLGIADYGAGKWRFNGPYSGSANFAVPSTGDYIAPGGSVNCIAIAYDGSRVVVDKLSLLLSANPPPAAPQGLAATVQAGSVRLNWLPVSAPGLLGYNVYYSFAPFSVAGQFSVARYNLDTIPASPAPQLDLSELSPGRAYYFRVAAVVADQAQSELSNMASATASYSLAIHELAPERQYPGLWVYVDGAGFDPAAGATQVVLGGTPLAPASVYVLSPENLRFRIPADAVPAASLSVRVRSGGQDSDVHYVTVVPASAPPRGIANIGQVLFQQYEMYRPAGVAVTAAAGGVPALLWVANYEARRLDSFTLDGAPYSTFAFNGARDIEPLSGGRLLVKDDGGPDVWVFDPYGAYQPGSGYFSRAIPQAALDATFGSGEFIATAADGTIYLSDTDNNVVRKWKGGAETGVIGAGIIGEPRDVELDASGNLVVADSGNDMVHWFTPAGVLLGSYDGSADLDPDDGELRNPWSLAIGADGTVYVGDRERDRVLRLNGTTRAFSGEWGRSGYLRGNGTDMPALAAHAACFWELSGMAVLPDGTLAVADQTNQRLAAYRAADGVAQRSFGAYSAAAGQFASPRSVAVRESDGAYTVLDDGAYTLTQFDRKNKLLRRTYLETFNNGDIGQGRMDRTGGWLAFAGNRLYFTHAYTRLTQTNGDFSNPLTLALDWGSDPARFKGMAGVAASGATLYAGDYDNDRIQVFENGSYSRSIAVPDPANRSIQNVAYDSAHGWLYALDRPWGDSRILRFNAATGALLDEQALGVGASTALACDLNGNVYVHYWGGMGLVHKYAPSSPPGGVWTRLCDMAAYGENDGEVRDVSGLTVAADGRVLVCDGIRRQVVVLTP